MANRIDEAFRRARAENCAAFMPFLTAGDPDLPTTAALIEELTRRGADLIELGVPYSDPIADGPTIQSSYVRALAGGLKVGAVFDMIRAVRARCNVALLTMVSFSIISRIGAEGYLDRAAAASVDGLIVPDLPVDEGRRLARQAAERGLHTVFLAAPTTPPERLRTIARSSRGFIYYVSVRGTTGARAELPADLAEHVESLRRMSSKPVAVGFGVSRPEQVAAVARIADGVIVGSAIVAKVHELAGSEQARLVSSVGEFVASLAAAKRRL